MNLIKQKDCVRNLLFLCLKVKVLTEKVVINE